MSINLREYGDLEKVKEDAKTLRDMLDRQGYNFVIDVLAEKVADTALKFKLSDEETSLLTYKLVQNLREQLLERT